MKTKLLVVAWCVSALLGCRPAATPVTDRCSKVALATVVAECQARIRLECAKDDKSCAAYQECKKSVKDWRQCPEVSP